MQIMNWMTSTPLLICYLTVNFIIETAKPKDDRRLVLLPVGKLTNIVLALKKDPSIAANVRIVWLGTNYPDPGE